MTIEREILVSLLGSTKQGPTDDSLISRVSRMPIETTQDLLGRLAEQCLLTMRGNLVDASPDQRVRIAVHALRLGADFERVCSMLEWREFEGVATETFKVNEYNVIRNFRFRGRSGKRWEIDLLAFKQPLILSVDCKHWQHRWTRAPVITVVRQQVERTRSFSEVLPGICDTISLNTTWTQATVIPVVLSLVQAPFKFHDNTPIVAVLQLQCFLSELPSHAGSLTSFRQRVPTRSKLVT